MELLTVCHAECGINTRSSMLKDLARKLERGSVIEYDFDTVQVLMSAAEEFEELEDYEIDYDELLYRVCELDNDTVSCLIEDIIENHLDPIDTKDADKKQIENAMDKMSEWYGYTAADLKEELRDIGLSDRGSKKDLINRLKEDWLEKSFKGE